MRPVNSVADRRQSTDRLHPLLARRWSPQVFDPSHTLGRADVTLLLEAARWAPSAGNSQPWAFIAGQRGDAVHQRLVRHVAGSASSWAPAASLLIANLAHRYVAGTDWEYSDFALYDLGQAVAHMTVQASALGLSVRQFRAFDQAGIAADFQVPDHWQVTSMAAFGRLPATAVVDAHTNPGRQRRPLTDILWPVEPPPTSVAPR
jgi:nitroreductase